MKRISEKVFVYAFVFILLIFTVWIGYNIYRYQQQDIKTQTVFGEQMPGSIRGTGIVIREEELIPSGSTGIKSYLFEDGTKVALSETVVEYYSTTVDDSRVNRMRAIRSEISLLEEAQNQNRNNYSNVEILKRDLQDQFNALNTMSATGNCNSLSSVSQSAFYLVNSRAIAVGKVENYNSRIFALEQEYAQLEGASTQNAIESVQTPVSGYFSHLVDGYEMLVDPQIIEDYSVQDYLDLMAQEVTVESSYVGKVATSQKWTMAIAISDYQTQDLYTGQSISLKFDQLDNYVPAKITNMIREKNNETAIVVVTSDHMSDNTINLRLSDVVVDFSLYRGLRIPTTALRFKEVDGQRVTGVWVLENYVVSFKTLDVIYEGQDYVLSRLYYYSDPVSERQSNVCMYDQIIIGGTDLYEGKIIQ